MKLHKACPPYDVVVTFRPGPDRGPGDSIDRVIADWGRERPDLPVAPIGVVTRIGRLRARFDEELAGLFSRYDLTSADFAVIASLRRSGAPYTLAQSQLMQHLHLTSGTVSVRLARLENKGVVQRAPSPGDGRGTLVRLTERGLQLFDQVAPAHLHNEDVLLSALTDQERTQLEALLRKLVVSFEHEDGTEVLGAVLTPAHVARRMRAAVGLGDEPGLLVRAVGPDTPAGRAGLREGDLLLEADGHPLRSCLALADLLPDGGSVVLRVRRGTRSITTTISVPEPEAPQRA